VIVTEFGITNTGINGGSCAATQYYQDLIDYAGADVHWVAWAWYPSGCGFPSLINDWSYNPSGAGSVVKAALQGL
jgi:hypothetical protein